MHQDLENGGGAYLLIKVQEIKIKFNFLKNVILNLF